MTLSLFYLSNHPTHLHRTSKDNLDCFLSFSSPDFPLCTLIKQDESLPSYVSLHSLTPLIVIFLDALLQVYLPSSTSQFSSAHPLLLAILARLRLRSRVGTFSNVRLAHTWVLPIWRSLSRMIWFAPWSSFDGSIFNFSGPLFAWCWRSVQNWACRITPEASERLVGCLP